MSQIRNLLVTDGLKDSILVLPGVLGVKEIRIHNSEYVVLNKRDEIIATYAPARVRRVNLSEKEIALCMKE